MSDDMAVKFHAGEQLPLEMHKVRIVQKLTLPPIEERLTALTEAGNNTFLLQNADVFLDMLTDSGVNAMSDRQQAAMLTADDSYAGSSTFTRLSATINDIFGTEYFLPAHQGRACENIIAGTLVKPGSTAIMNYHFTTTKAHVVRFGGVVEEVIGEGGLQVESDAPFKGDFDLDKLADVVGRVGAQNVSFIRVESGTNLVGGQPVSLQNMKEVSAFARGQGILTASDIAAQARASNRARRPRRRMVERCSMVDLLSDRGTRPIVRPRGGRGAPARFPENLAKRSTRGTPGGRTPEPRRTNRRPSRARETRR